MLHWIGHEAAHPGDAFLDDGAGLRGPAVAAAEAQTEFASDAVVGPIGEVFIRLALQVEFEIALVVGASSETIAVNTGTPLVNPTDPTIEDTVDEKTVVSLPLNGRKMADLVFTAGGVGNSGENTGTGQVASTNQITPPGVTVPGSIAPSVNGVRALGPATFPNARCVPFLCTRLNRRSPWGM